MSKIKNITRMEYKRSHGWWVRFQYNRQSYNKFFSDNKFGGESLALLSAIAWMKNVKAKNKVPDTIMRVDGATRSNTGVQGVSYCSKSNSYFASWTDAIGQASATSFSVNKYGREKAFKLACKKREEKLKWRLDGNILPEYPPKRRLFRDPKKYTKEELIEILIKKSKELKRIPTSRDFKKIKPRYSRFESAFGGWNKAIEAAGLRKP